MSDHLASQGDNHSMEEKILASFRAAGDQFVSGEDLSKELGISRAAIWKYIEHLRALGYTIDAQPHHGYKLTAVPDRLLPSEITWQLQTHAIGQTVQAYNQVDSTNTVAYTQAINGAAHGTVIIAETQTAGRGRLGRVWASPAGGGIYCSLILRPDILPNEAPEITLIAAVSIAITIRTLYGIDAVIRWPNDIMCQGKKVSGLLTEMQAEQDRVQFIVLGIGINVNTPQDTLPDVGTSLSAVSGKTLSRIELCRKLLETFEDFYDTWQENGFEPIITEWRNLSGVLGKRVRITIKGEQREGQAMDIDDHGNLMVRYDTGFTDHISAGDVEMIR